MLTKACCKGNNYEQRFALDTFPADFSWRNVLAKPCILLFTLQQDCNTREACRSLSWYPFSPWRNSSELGFAHGLSKALLLVVKVVFVVFPNSAGIMSPQALCFGVYLAAGRIGNFSCFSPSAGRVFLRVHFKPLGRWRILRKDKAIESKNKSKSKRKSKSKSKKK